MIRAVIFDMDGVIVNSEHLHYETDSRIFRHFRIQIPEEERIQFVGMSVQKFYNTLCSRYAPWLSPDYMIEFDRRYRAWLFRNEKLEAPPGLMSFLKVLRKKNISVALASGSSPQLIRIILKSLNLENFFDAVLSSEEVSRPKPWPDVFLKAAELLKFSPSECMVIEDATLGIKAACEAGMYCVGFKNPNAFPQDLSEAHMIIHSFAELNEFHFDEIFRIR